MGKGAIFDVDGTLLDSMPIWEDASVRFLDGLGIQAEEQGICPENTAGKSTG